MASSLDDPALMGHDRTKMAAAEAAAMTDDAELHFTQSGNASLRLIARVVCPQIRQVVDLVHFLLGQRQRRRILHHTGLSVPLDELSAANRVLLQIFQLERLGKGALVFPRLVEGRKRQIIIDAIEIRHAIASAADVLNRVHADAPMQLRRDFQDLTLPHAVNQKVGAAVHQDGAAHAVRPVIVMRQTPKTRLDAADDDRDAGPYLPQPIRIDRDGARRPAIRPSPRRIRVLAPLLSCRRKLVEQGIHVSAGNEKSQPGAAQLAEIFPSAPVRLCDNPNPVSVLLKKAAENGRSETRMIHISISGHEDKIKRVPAPLRHILFCHRQKSIHALLP